METADFITDVRHMAPVYHTFSPDFRGFVHEGFLQAAQFVLQSVLKALQMHECPQDIPILVTGESLDIGE